MRRILPVQRQKNRRFRTGVSLSPGAPSSLAWRLARSVCHERSADYSKNFDGEHGARVDLRHSAFALGVSWTTEGHNGSI